MTKTRRDAEKRKRFIARLSRGGAILVLAWAAYWAVRLACADHLGRHDDLASRERAVRLAPLSAALYERLALKRDELGGVPVPDFERAAALDPANARRSERLGQRAEMAGDFALAEWSLLRAAELSRLYQPRYLLAQYYFRRRNPAEWDRWLREALAIAPGDVTPLVELALRMQPDIDATVFRPAIARQFLFLMVRNREMAAAAGVARHLAENGSAADLPPILGYCEQALADADVRSAAAIWNTLCRRRLLPYPALDASPVTNGDFAYPATGNAFDWHIEGPENSAIAWQYVPLRRGATYRLRFDGGEGLRWSVFYPVEGGWRELAITGSLRFRAPSNLIRLALMRRAPHVVQAIDARNVRLEIEP